MSKLGVIFSSKCMHVNFYIIFHSQNFFKQTIYYCRVVLCTVSFESWQTSWPDSIKELGCLYSINGSWISKFNLFCCFFSMQPHCSPQGQTTKKVGVDNEKALELDNNIIFSYFSLISMQKYHPKMQQNILLHSGMITPNILV